MDLALLDFWPGLAFEDSLRLNLASSVCTVRPRLRSSFCLVVSFGRCIFKLNPVSVGHLLQAALGGFASGFEVLQLADRVFRFPRWLWVFIFTISDALIARNSGLSSTFGIMVALTGNMNSRIFRMKKRHLGSRFGARRVYLLRILLSSLSLVPMLFRFVTTLSLPVALSVRLGLERLCSVVWVLPLVIWLQFATIGGYPLVGFISLALESRRSIVWACRLHPLGRSCASSVLELCSYW
jgi:hypothetical protein